jgi:hypothetical protein
MKIDVSELLIGTELITLNQFREYFIDELNNEFIYNQFIFKTNDRKSITGDGFVYNFYNACSLETFILYWNKYLLLKEFYE